MEPMKVESMLLDRDGVINRLIDRDGEEISPQSIEDFEFLPGSREAIRMAKERGLSIYVISNQPDVSKKWRSLNKDKLEQIDQKLKEIGIDQIYNCVHGPLGNRKNKTYRDDGGDIRTCDCRKPQPGLIDECFSENRLTAEKTVLVGDSRTDMIAAKRFEEKNGERFYSKIKLGDDEGLCHKNMGCLMEVVKELL